jgi:hypothetical protein
MPSCSIADNGKLKIIGIIVKWLVRPWFQFLFYGMGKGRVLVLRVEHTA